MAGLIFSAYDTEEKEIAVSNVLSYELSKDEDAACHGLRLYFISKVPLPELFMLRAKNNGTIVFNGYVDTQRETSDEKGTVCFVFARSTACVLLDNEAKPQVYFKPTAEALFLSNAKGLGFSSDLPEIVGDTDYQVDKGKSCYAAINDFVYNLTGKSMVVDVDNHIKLRDDGTKRNVDSADIISVKRTINRGGIICRLDCKTDESEDYTYHFKSKYFENKKILTSKKQNISSMSLYRRQYALKNILEKSAADYFTYEIRVNGSWNGDLYDLVEIDDSYFGSTDDCVVSSLRYSMNDSGTETKIVLRKKTDLEEITYVAE
ncbi:MAG: hypothetical protein SO393_08305 [Eubacterium sp.]|nr:hypothetical protein [Eubacterium sp.]